MNNNRFKNFIFKFFFLLVAFFNLIKYEADIASSTDYCYYPDIVTNEQVVKSCTHFTLQSPQNPPVLKETKTDSKTYCFNDFFIHHSLFLNSKEYPANQSSTIEIVNTPHYHIVSILRQKNIPHLDEPFPYNFC
ncbi:hypothetical protein JW964_26360 [candidate division KSB1 bacterium]|nr:hypothetical protein [candidate division KSB1 bacterium]